MIKKKVIKKNKEEEKVVSIEDNNLSKTKSQMSIQEQVEVFGNLLADHFIFQMNKEGDGTANLENLEQSKVKKSKKYF